MYDLLRIIVLQIEFDAKIVKTLRRDVMPEQKAVCLSLHSERERRGRNIPPSLLNLVRLQKTLGDSRSNPCEQRQTRRCKKITMSLIDFWHKSGPDIFPPSLSLFFFKDVSDHESTGRPTLPNHLTKKKPQQSLKASEFWSLLSAVALNVCRNYPGQHTNTHYLHTHTHT